MVVLKGNNVQPVPRKLAVELVPQIGKRFAGVQQRGADTERAGDKFVRSARFGNRAGRFFKHLFGAAVDHLSGGGQPNTVVGAHKQLQGKVLFQRVDLLDHGGGRNVELFCGSVKAAAVRHADKAGQQGVEHGRTSIA